jgi:hypothetical protein
MTGLTHPQCLGEKGATRSGVLPPFKLYISSSLPKFNTWTTGGSLSPFPIPRLVDWTVAGEQQIGQYESASDVPFALLASGHI